MIRVDGDPSCRGFAQRAAQRPRDDHVAVDQDDDPARGELRRVWLQQGGVREPLPRQLDERHVRRQALPLPGCQPFVEDDHLFVVTVQPEGVDERREAGEVARVRDRVEGCPLAHVRTLGRPGASIRSRGCRGGFADERRRARGAGPARSEDRVGSDSIARNTVFATASTAVSAAIAVVLTLYLVRALSPHGYGTYTLALAIGALVALPMDFGISSSAGRFIAERRGDRQAIADYIADALRLKVAIARPSGSHCSWPRAGSPTSTARRT